jgi:hypothetical protein
MRVLEAPQLEADRARGVTDKQEDVICFDNPERPRKHQGARLWQNDR